MKIDVAGHLYVAGATGVWVFEPDGTHLGVLVTPERPANLAWGDDDRKSLYVTARSSLYRFSVKVEGLVGGRLQASNPVQSATDAARMAPTNQRRVR